MERREKIALQKICREIDLALEFIGEKNLEEFLQDKKNQLATGMTAVLIGEFTKNFSSDFRQKYSQVPFDEAEKFGDFVASEYDNVDLKDLFAKVKNDFPEMKTQIEKILELYA